MVKSASQATAKATLAKHVAKSTESGAVKAAQADPKKKKRARRRVQYVFKSTDDYNRFFIWFAKRLPFLHPA